MLNLRSPRRFATLLLLLSLLGGWGAPGLTGLMGQTNWVIRHYGLAEGLPDRSVVRVARDSFGFRWIATETGLWRFDGHRFDRPPALGALGLDGENVIRRMLPDRRGNLVAWTGGSKHLLFLNFLTNEVAKSTPPPPTLDVEATEQFFLQSPHPPALWRTGGGQGELLHPAGPARWRVSFTLLGGISTDSRYLGRSPHGHHFIHDRGANSLLRYDSSYNETFVIPLPDTAELMYLDRSGQIWFRGQRQDSVQYLSPGQDRFRTAVTLTAAAGPDRFNRCFEDERGNLIFAELGRLRTTALLLRTFNGNHLDLASVLRRENRLIAISGADFERGFDLASYGGYYRVTRTVDRLAATRYLHDADLPVNRYGVIMRGLTEADDGTVYANTEGARWFRFRPPHYRIDTLDTGAAPGWPRNGTAGSGHNLCSVDNRVYGLYAARGGMQTEGFLVAYQPDTDSWRHYSIPSEGSFGRFVLPLPDGDLIVFTFRSSDRATRIFRFDPITEQFTPLGSLNEELPRRSRTSVQNAIYDAGRDTVWVAAGNGIFAFCAAASAASNRACYVASQDKIERYPEVSFPVQSLLLEPEGTLLLGTYGEGVQRFDPATRQLELVAYDTRSGEPENPVIELPSNAVAELRRLDENRLAITTFNGLVVADLESRRTQNYSKSDGLADDEFNRLSALRTRRGQFFAGGINGLTRIGLDRMLPQRNGPTPRLSRYYAYDPDAQRERVFYPTPAREGGALLIPPQQLYLGFNFTTPGVENPSYRTWLEGQQIGYGPASEQGEAEYLRVPAGRYVLHVEATDAFGRVSAEPLQIAIRVQKPWYLRPWFLVLSQLLLIGIGVFIYRRRVRMIRAQETEKTRINRQLAELEMKILRQQLNPHFIFNALGAIQHFIQSMRGPAAMEYLADFAKLMRMFLESSKQSYIFLTDELKLIRLYVRLEQLRFNDRFGVVYEIDPELDLDMEDIPSLLLQPFVENAINHGLFHLQRRGTLTIGMRLDEDERIVCTVADDGVGRRRAAQLRNQTYKKHKSRATQIVAERLEIFQRSGNSDVEIITEDLYPDREETGTKVTIIIAAE